MHRPNKLASRTLAPLSCLLAAGAALAGPEPHASAPPAQGAWLDRARQSIESQRYFFVPAGPTEVEATNPAQGLRSRVGPGGLEVFPTQDDGQVAEWRLGLRTSALGRGDDLIPLAEPALEALESYAILERGPLTGWFVNDARGIEQGWTIDARPEGERGLDLRIAVEVSGLRPVLAADGQSARFLDEDGVLRVRYEGLAAWDASGIALDARLEERPGGFAVRVADESALYPVTVDPILSGPIWTWTAPPPPCCDHHLTVASAGDVNGDGYDDVLAGQRLYSNGETAEGAAWVFFGSPSGPSTSPDWSFESDVAGGLLGTMVAGGGDVNGDGYDDILVSSPLWDGPFTDCGRAWLFKGSATGPSLTPSWIVTGTANNFHLGEGGDVVRDVNGDGFDEVLLASENFTGPNVLVYYGSPTGTPTTASWTYTDIQYPNWIAGTSCAGAGDVNGDGYGDILVGVWSYDGVQFNEGGVYVFHGSSTGLPAGPNTILESMMADAGGGNRVAAAGDVNGDGFDDVAYSNGGDNGIGGWRGVAWVHLGSASGVNASAAWMVQGPATESRFGQGLDGAGDLNGDGYDDLAVGAPYLNLGSQSHTRIYLGRPSGLHTVPAQILADPNSFGQFGTAVGGKGDFDGDGLPDLVVADNYENRAHAWYGVAGTDCNDNGLDDTEDIATGTSQDCNSNDVPDECEIASGAGDDCNANGILDECEPDCNANDVADSCDISSGTSLDCNSNGIPDECDDDCNANGVPDDCDVASETSPDCNSNGLPDECDIASETSADCDDNGIPDECDIAGGALDCDLNGVPDDCDLAAGAPDCNANGIPDVCDIAGGAASDLDGDGVPDACQIANVCRAKRNSAGCTPSIGSTGIPSLTGPDDFVVTADDVVGGASGVLMWSLRRRGRVGGVLRLMGGAPIGGRGCLAGAQPLGSQTAGGTPGTCEGTFAFPVTQADMAGLGLAAGMTAYVQIWYADPPHHDGSRVGHTDALEFPVFP